MPHIAQAKVEIIETVELALRRCVRVGLERKDTRSSIISAVVANDGNVVGHQWIVEIVGKDHHVRTRLQREVMIVREIREREEERTLIGTSMVSHVSSARLNWMAVHPFSSRP